MKKTIAFILLPLSILITLLQAMYESVIEPLSTSIGNGINELLTTNYEFWKKVFRWK